MKYTVTIKPDDVMVEVQSGTVLSSVFEKAGINLWYPCGKQGTCGKCKVVFLSDAPLAGEMDSKTLTESEINQGTRLACKCRIKSNCVIEVPEAARQSGIVSLTRTVDREQELNPKIRKLSLGIPKSSLENPASDSELITDVLQQETGKQYPYINADLLRKLPAVLREQDFVVTATISAHQIIDIEPGICTDQNLAVALDLGTTTIVASLIDLYSGKTLAVEAVLNPQAEGGDDLISRIYYITAEENALQQLQERAIQAINTLINKLIRKTDRRIEHIYQFVVAGNTVMNHIFLGVNPQYVGVIPFAPVFKNTVSEQTDNLGINASAQGQVLTLPNIGGFVGGDIVADMLVAGFGNNNNSTRLLIDIGTNCEVVLEHNGRRLATSSPAGPALEGARISRGMRAEAGAISDLFINGTQAQITTINNKPPIGLCGSGLFHSIEALLRVGLIDLGGRIPEKAELEDTVAAELLKILDQDSEGLPRIRLAGGAMSVFLSQKDIREFQLAKAAISTAWDMLCQQIGCKPEKVDQVFIAGAFGNFIRPETLLYLGIVPQIESSRIHFIGNAALEGARMVLYNHENLKQAEALAAETAFVELASKAEFQQVYVEHLTLGTFF